MARARNIKPSFFLNDKLAELPDKAKLLFIGLWCLCDSEGKMEWNPKRVRAELFPYDPDVDCTMLAQCLHGAGFIQTYVVDSEWYLWVPKFTKHQNTHIKEQPKGLPDFSESYIVAPCEYGASTVQKLPLTESPILKSEIPILNPECGKQENAAASLTQKPTKVKKDARLKTRLGEFLQASGGNPPLEWGEWANREFGWDGQRLGFEWDAFATDFWLTDNCLKYDGGRKADWFATWRNHCRDKATQRGRGSNTGGKACSGYAAAFAASVAARYGISSAGSGFGGGNAANRPEPEPVRIDPVTGRREIPF